MSVTDDSATPTESDEGKTVIDADGEQVGLVVEVAEGTAHIDPDPGVIDRLGARFGWSDGSGDTYPLGTARIEAITGDAIRLRPDRELTFQEKSVAESADHQYAFYGSITYYEDGDEREHTLTREFAVHIDPADRTGEGYPVAELSETHLASVTDGETDTREERDVLEEHTDELVIEIPVDQDRMQEHARIEEFCREWHTEHAPADEM